MKSKQKNDNMFSCSHCDKVFKYNSEKIRHETSHLKNFECDLCNKKFGFISALRRHRKQHDRKGGVKCNECYRKCRDEVLLQRHIKYAHKGKFTCSKCSTTFSSNPALRTHMKVHKPAAQRRFKCSYRGCNKSFNFSHHLKHHELTHSDAKQHFCGVCGKGFIQSHHLKTHLKSHDPTEWRHCDFNDCNKKFSTEYAKKRHMATHKNKPDSGISSDSSSNEASIKLRETVAESEIKGIKIQSNEVLEASINILEAKSPILVKDSSIEINSSNCIDKSNEALNTPKETLFTDVEDCKVAIGTCIAKDRCICEEINNSAKNTKETHTENSIETNTIVNNHTDKFDIMNLSMKTPVNIKQINMNNNYSTSNACEGCDCASICTEEDRAICINLSNNLPNIENRNGVIKLTDTFDIDFKTDNNNESFIPFGTCKDVLGKCIVEGDGCLCAKMTVDDQQAMAQEIDDITPQPATYE